MARVRYVGFSEEPAAEDGASGRSPIEGFDEIAFAVSPEGAEASTWCALLADRPELRSQGLMDQDDLRGLGNQSGFELRRTWHDKQNRFSSNLYVAGGIDAV